MRWNGLGGGGALGERVAARAAGKQTWIVRGNERQSGDGKSSHYYPLGIVCHKLTTNALRRTCQVATTA